MKEYIVKLKNKKYHDKFISFLLCHNIKYEYLNDLEIYNIKITPSCSQIIKNFPYVDIIVPDTTTSDVWIIPSPDDPDDPGDNPYPENKKNPANWGPYKIKAPFYWKDGYTGQGINVAVIDGGISDHDYLNIKGRVYIAGANIPANDHGTWVAGIIAAQPNCPEMTGVAYGCNLYDVNVSARDDSASNSYQRWNVFKGVEWCIDNNMHVINMSFGSLATNDTEETKRLYYDVVTKAKNNGIFVVASSGNNNLPEVKVPAQFTSVFGIGAIDINNNRWVDAPDLGSNYGRGLNFVAPGDKVITTHRIGLYEILSGTSMATPHVVGLIALILSKTPNLDFVGMRDLLEFNALRLPVDNVSGFEYGYGLVQAIR